MNFQKKKLNIPPEWEVKWNHFLDLDPDNDYPIDNFDVWHYFTLEDISYFIFGEYFIDVGYYGTYENNRSGTFRLIVSKGDFNDKPIFVLESRSSNEIKIATEKYMKLIVNKEIC